MFVENDDDIMESIDRIMIGENEFHKNLFKIFARLDENELAALESIIDKFIEMKKKKTDSLSTASLVGVKIQHEFVYPFEDFFALYLFDYFNDSLHSNLLIMV